ncbi:LysM peptidoglycan-binding domain-containing protein [Sinomicrobium kalidii]|uniref:LysM peptidoglycan-binding domain-containing protein n=1 Tax=Sinomicrobium kalidii TaxID=2900738 RepID=UPI001E44C270|nr:LysM peptidoglycan-binding domain-containing protein [Sinomicrobium kalidii]UGU16277.1 LysM peptidoglycan-binding domain-containing protein [Sinomicrobium kalidii]
MGFITKYAGGKFIRIARGDINNYADVINQSAAISINETAEEGICFGTPEDPPPGDLLINSAYFAKKKTEPVFEETKEKYTVVSGDNLSNIARNYEGATADSIMKENKLDSDVIQVGQELSITGRQQTGEKTSFERVTGANVGDAIYVVAEHFGAVNCIQVTLKEKEALLTDGGALAVLQDDNEITTIELGEPQEEELKGSLRYARIELRPKDDEKLEEWQEKLQEEEILGYTDGRQSIPPESYDTMIVKNGWEPEYGDTVKSLLSIEVEAQAEGEVIYCGRDRSNIFLNEDEEWFEVTGSKVIHIYHTGHISEVDLTNSKKVSYVYHDENDEKYNLITCDLYTVKKKGTGQPVDSFREEEPVETIDYTSYNSMGVDAKTSHIYEDGTVITDGNKYGQAHYKIKYPALDEDIILVHMKEINNRTAEIQFHFEQTKREYANPEYFAAFLGALADIGLDVSCTGSCYKDGSAFPSLEHSNGFAIDTGYLWTLEDDQKIIDAMKKFGFSKRIRGSSNYLDGLTDHTKRDGGSLHDTHLHCSQLSPKYKD